MKVGVKVRDVAVVKAHPANLSLTIFAKWKQTAAFKKKWAAVPKRADL